MTPGYSQKSAHLMGMFNVYTEPQHIQNSSLCFYHLILEVHIVLIENQWTNFPKKNIEIGLLITTFQAKEYYGANCAMFHNQDIFMSALQ